MDDLKHKTLSASLLILMGAAAMGLLGDVLFHDAASGINVGIWFLALFFTATVLAQRLPDGKTGIERWPAVLSVFFAMAIAWRASSTLQTLNVFALLSCLGLAAARLRHERRLAWASLTDYARGMVKVGGASVFGGLGLVFRDISWREIPYGSRVTRLLVRLGIGLVVALPLLLVFGSLLTAADPIFNHLVHQTLDLNLTELGSHLTLIALGTLVVGGYLRCLFGVRPSLSAERQRPGFLFLGTVEIAIVLGLLDFLFLAFVIVQARYFFGGARMVQQTAGLTYAQYARGGFFELVTVAALVLPMLLVLHWLHHSEGQGGRRVFQALAGLQIGLLFVIMDSAIQRMHLYQSEYGQTELRLYTTAFMAWLALVFVWFSVTVLRERRAQFACGAFLTALSVIVVLNAIDPDAIIVRTNAALARAGHPFDVTYAASLSADAVPALVAVKPLLNAPQAQILSARLAAVWALPQQQDWRSWNWSRAVAGRFAARENDKGILKATAK